MVDDVRSGWVWLYHAYFRIDHVISGYVSLGQVTSVWTYLFTLCLLGLVSSGQFILDQVKSGYVRLCQVRSVYVRLSQVRSGYIRLVQVRSGLVRLC
jgi:hypothetical protein